MMTQKNAIVLERKSRTDYHFISSKLSCSADHDASPKQAVSAPASTGEIILLLAHARLSVLHRWLSNPQRAVRKAKDLLAVTRPRRSRHSWSRGRRTRNVSMNATGARTVLAPSLRLPNTGTTAPGASSWAGCPTSRALAWRSRQSLMEVLV